MIEILLHFLDYLHNFEYYFQLIDHYSFQFQWLYLYIFIYY